MASHSMIRPVEGSSYTKFLRLQSLLRTVLVQCVPRVHHGEQIQYSAWVEEWRNPFMLGNSSEAQPALLPTLSILNSKLTAIVASPTSG